MRSQDMAGCDVVIEAIVERLDAKQALVRRTREGGRRRRCILATNTSSLSVTAIAAGCRHPGRVAGLHFFNPVPLMRIVEIIGGARTAPVTVDKLKALVATTSHAGVEVQDTPGFLINHAGRGYTTEALRVVQEGVASFAEVDLIMREQVRFETGGFRLGPFELLDLTGLDVSQPVMESIYRQFYDEPRFRPSVIGCPARRSRPVRSQDRRRLLHLSGRRKQPQGPLAPARVQALLRQALRQPAPPPSPVPVFVFAQDHAPGLPALVERLGGRLVNRARPRPRTAASC